MKGQIVADFIVGHKVDKQLDLNVGYVTFTPWKLHFDGSVCKDDCGVGVVIISLSGAVFEALNRLDHDCTDYQTEYEALLLGLGILHDMGLKHVEAYGDSLLVVQQVSKVCQCLNDFLNAYVDKCLDIISCMDEFVIYHVPREENPRANALAQQAYGYNVRKRNFQEHKSLLTTECFALEAPVRPTQPTGLTDDNGLTDVADRSDRSLKSGSVHGTGLTDAHDRSDRSPDKDSSLVFFDKNEVGDWRKPLVDYLRNPSGSVDRKVPRWALKFIIDDGELYCRITDDLLLSV
jgi:ribonuclease HI